MILSKIHAVDSAGQHLGYTYLWWCPGCGQSHIWQMDSTTGSNWEFDGNFEAPTVSPSILTHIRGDKSCHVFIKAGLIEFLADSWHHLAGQKVPMVPLPHWLARESNET
jgi:hypothetical protein